MPDSTPDITLEETRARIRLSGLPIPAAREALVQRFLADALRPLRAVDPRDAQSLEPAVTFDAAAEEHRRGRA
jgi:hypothetical protein